MSKLSDAIRRASLVAAIGLPVFLTACGGGGGGGSSNDDGGGGSAPIVVATFPADQETGVALNRELSVTFSAEMDCATVTAGSLTLNNQGGGAVSGTVSCTGNGASFKPDAPLAPGAAHTAAVTAAVKDKAGHALAAKSWSFTTGAAPDVTPPEVLSTLPASGDTGVPTNTSVSVVFSEPMDCATLTASTLVLHDAGGAGVDGAVSCGSSTATLTPAAELAANTEYVAAVTTGAKDGAGNALATGHAWTFTTGAAPDRTPPTVVSTTPTSDAVDVATDTSVSVTFSEPVDCSTVTAATFTVKTASNSPVAGTVVCSDAGATFRPSERLARSTEYVAALAAGIRDLAGNSLGAEHDWRFTSGRAWDVATLMEGANGEVDDPQVAVNDAGAAVTVWVQSDAANQKHLWLSLHPSGGSWSAPEEVEALAGDAAQPQVVMDANGDSLVAWTQTDSAGSAVWTRVRAANGAWGGAWKLWGYAPALGIDGSGNVTCVWKHSDGTRINGWASRYPLGTAPLSGGWKAAETIEADDNRSVMFRLSVAVNRDGDATVVWTFYDKAASEYTVTANRYSAASDSWGSAVDVIPGDIKAPVDPTVVMNDAGEAMAVWRKEYSTTYGYATVAFYSLYSGTGASAAWGAWGSLATMNGLLARAPAVVGNGRGDVFVAWEEAYTAYYRRYQAGVGWGPETYLASSVDRPAAAIDASGNIMVAWGSNDDGSLRARRYSATAAAWDGSSAIVGSASTAMLPAIASDSNGVVTAVWSQWDGSRHNLLANRFE